MAPAIGIDLGTTYSCVAVWQHEQVEIIANDQGSRTTPSCVSFSTDAGRLVGEGAKNQIKMNPTNTIYDAKRMIGRRFKDGKLQEDMKLWPFKVINGSNDIPKIIVEYNGKKEFSAEEISSMILAKLKEFAEAFLGETVKDAVITVPAYFDDSQRQATKDAGHVAGLNVLQIINEPTSAAIAYGLDMKKDITRDTNVLIFDLGGGTFDVSLVTIDGKGKIKVKAVSGDTHLGGEDFDNKVVDHFVKLFNQKYKTDMSGNKRAVARLRAECEKAKRTLSSATVTPVVLDGLHEGIDFSMSLSRAKFEDLNGDFFRACIKMVETCLKDANMNEKDVDEVVLVGGSTRIPKVQELLKQLFKGKELSQRIHADEAVAYGAAVLAAKLSGERSKKVENIVLMDVVPLSLGVDLYDGKFSVVIERNSPIPAKMEKNYVTVKDNQSMIVSNVYQGERTWAKDNNWLGKIQVAVPPAPRGESKVTVVFDIDANGILTCSLNRSGEGVSSGHGNKITITSDKQRLSEEEMEKMLKDAGKYKLEDDKYKEKDFARNALEEYINNVKTKIKSLERIRKEDKDNMESAIQKASEITEGSKRSDVDKYEKTLIQLKKVCDPIMDRPPSKKTFSWAWWKKIRCRIVD